MFLQSKMSRFILSLATFCIVVSLYSCQKSYHIHGTTDAFQIEGRRLSLKMMDSFGNWRTLDSCEICHGAFDMRGVVDSIVMATVFVEHQPLMPVIVEPGHIELTLNNTDLQARGTRLNDRLYTFIAQKTRIDNRVADLMREE